MRMLIQFLQHLSTAQVANIVTVISLILTLTITTITVVQNNRHLKASNYLLITQHHREIWLRSTTQADFERVFQPDADPSNISDGEFTLVNLIFLHMSAAYKLTRKGATFPVDGMRDDLVDILSYPIPFKVWDEVKQYHDKSFVKYVTNTWKRRHEKPPKHFSVQS